MKKNRIPLLALLAAGACVTGGYYYHKFHSSPPVEARTKERGHCKATTRFQALQYTYAPSPYVETNPSGISWLEAQINVLSSDRVLERVVKRLNLEAEWKTTPGQALKRLQNSLDIELEQKTEIVSVTAWGDAPDQTAAIANGVRETYEEIRNEAETERARRVVENLDATIKVQDQLVAKLKAEMEAVQEKYGITNIAPLNITAQQAAGPEYTNSTLHYESSRRLLDHMRELSARQEVDEAVVKKPVDLLERAEPPSP